jgi:hypothetical protein
MVLIAILIGLCGTEIYGNESRAPQDRPTEFWDLHVIAEVATGRLVDMHWSKHSLVSGFRQLLLLVKFITGTRIFI